MSTIDTLWQFVTQLFFPPHCFLCQRPGEPFCAHCGGRVVHFQPPRCQRCDMPQSKEAGPLCETCQRQPSALSGLRVVGPHIEPLRGAIHALKYANARSMGDPLGELLVERWQAAGVPVEGVIPVPLHPERLQERGYNQATLLAKAVADATDKPMAEGLLQRVRATPPQVGLGRVERQQNVSQAFRASPQVAGRRWLLVDDVCTTGSTLEACAAALRGAGAPAVWALVLARPAPTSPGESPS